MTRSRLAQAVRWIAGSALILGIGAALGVAGWRTCGRYGHRCEDAGQFFPIYNAAARRIDLVIYDLNGNGMIDTWVYRNQQHIERVRIDRNEDGTIDRTLLPDAAGTLRVAAMNSRR